MNRWFGRSKTQPGGAKAAPAAATAKHPFDLSVEPKPGFLGNLDELQLQALQQFKQKYEDKVKLFVDQSTLIGYTTEEQIALNQAPSNTPGTSQQFTEIDAFLLRILRARAFNHDNASMMMDEYLKWRVSFHVEEICEVVRFPWVVQLRAVYPHGYHGVDKIGRPVYIERVGKADIGAALKLASLDHFLAYWVQSYEYVRRVVLPACSIAAGRRIEQGISIIDLSGLGFSHCGAQTRNVLRQVAKLSQDYFPEMLGAMVLVNAPAVFSPVWSFARTLIDERTVAKMTLLTSRSAHWKQYLQDIVNADQLPEFLGGTAPDKDWDSNSKGPWTDPAILDQLGTRFPSIPQQLLHFDIHVGNVASLKSLDGIKPPSVAVAENEEEMEQNNLQATTAEAEEEIEADMYKLSASGVNVVE